MQKYPALVGGDFDNVDIANLWDAINNIVVPVPVGLSLEVTQQLVLTALGLKGTEATQLLVLNALGLTNSEATQQLVLTSLNLRGTEATQQLVLNAVQQLVADNTLILPTLQSIDANITLLLTLVEKQYMANNFTTSVVLVGVVPVMILATNTNRKGWQVANVGGTILYLGYNNTITNVKYYRALPNSNPNETYEQMGVTYTGDLWAVRNSGSTNCVITELT